MFDKSISAAALRNHSRSTYHPQEKPQCSIGIAKEYWMSVNGHLVKVNFDTSKLGLSQIRVSLLKRL